MTGKILLSKERRKKKFFFVDNCFFATLVFSRKRIKISHSMGTLEKR